MWNIDQYNEATNFDDESNKIPWSFQEVTNEAKNFECIVITLDGQRHDIPVGGGIVRTSSALNFGEFKTTASYPGGMTKLINDIFKEDIIQDVNRQLWAENPIMYRIKKNLNQLPKEPEMPDGLLYARRVYDVINSRD